MTPEIQRNYCSECGQPAAPDEMVRFGDRLVCPNCKNAYAQKLREGVAPAGFVRYGGFWLRFLAVLIDGIIMAVPIGIIQVLLIGAMGLSMTRVPVGPNPSPDEVMRTIAPMFAVIGLSATIGMAIGCLYETFFVAKFAATPGKMAVGVKVVRPDGSNLSVGRAIGRYFSKMLSAMIL
jgi:uncharacterized RDD family membrane protein YckC